MQEVQEELEELEKFYGESNWERRGFIICAN